MDCKIQRAGFFKINRAGVGTTNAQRTLLADEKETGTFPGTTKFREVFSRVKTGRRCLYYSWTGVIDNERQTYMAASQAGWQSTVYFPPLSDNKKVSFQSILSQWLVDVGGMLGSVYLGRYLIGLLTCQDCHLKGYQHNSSIFFFIFKVSI